MLKDIIKKNNQIISENLKNAFGENYEIEVHWGYPLCLIDIIFNKDGINTSTKVTINMETENYSLTILGSKTTKMTNENGDKESLKIEPEAVSIDKNTIMFIMNSAINITEQLSVSKQILEKEKETESEKILNSKSIND